MDPPKSLFDMDYSFDPLIPEDNFGFVPSSELDLFGYDSFLTNDFGNDDFLSTLYLDDPIPSSFDDQFGQSYHHQQQLQQQQPLLPPPPSNNFFANPASAINNNNNNNHINKNNSKFSNSSRKINAKAHNGVATGSILEQENVKSGRPRISTSSPKVYVSKSKKEIRGTSILVKQKKIKKKCSSSLLSNKSSLLPNVANVSNQNYDDTKAKGLFHDFFWSESALRDHDYCCNETQDDAQVTENDIADILGGFCTDDVMLNELPECLGGLLNFSDDYTSCTSEDILNGLNNVCNVMTDQFIAENILDTKDLPDLNLTEEIINQVTQCCDPEPEIPPIKKEEDVEEVIEAIEGLIKSETIETTIILNHNEDHNYSNCISMESTVDNCDSSSVTTGCTDESFIEEKQHILRLNDQKSKRHRSLSSSSAILTKRKRRFSTRSSINSSDSMSDSSSSPGSSSSRSSSPERAFDFVPTPPFTASNYHAINFEQLKKYKKNRPQFLKQPFRSNKPYSNLLTKEKKCQVIDSVNQKIYTLESKLQSGGVSASRHHHQMSANLRNKNNYVLYIENIPENCRKSDIYNWFGKFGNIQDVQIYTKDAKYFASVEYQNFHEIEKARKHGNDDPSHPKFLLTFGNDRRKNYKDNNLDSFTEKLDFRIEDHSGDGIIDGGSSSCSSENGIGAVDFDTFLSKSFI